MRKVIIDTNVYSSFKRNISEVVTAFQHLDFIGINVVVLGELYAGFTGGRQERRNRIALETFMNSSRVQYVDNTIDTAEYYAKIFNSLKMKGTPIPSNDIWIAASALENGLALFTLDAHFSNIDGLLIHRF